MFRLKVRLFVSIGKKNNSSNSRDTLDKSMHNSERVSNRSRGMNFMFLAMIVMKTLEVIPHIMG